MSVHSTLPRVTANWRGVRPLGSSCSGSFWGLTDIRRNRCRRNRTTPYKHVLIWHGKPTHNLLYVILVMLECGHYILVLLNYYLAQAVFYNHAYRSWHIMLTCFSASSLSRPLWLLTQTSQCSGHCLRISSSVTVLLLMTRD